MPRLREHVRSAQRRGAALDHLAAGGDGLLQLRRADVEPREVVFRRQRVHMVGIAAKTFPSSQLNPPSICARIAAEILRV